MKKTAITLQNRPRAVPRKPMYGSSGERGPQGPPFVRASQPRDT
jgi:hypothetical protein